MGQGTRLDSWKAIAEYLGRDVRTAMRWSKTKGLPVRRVAGKGRSVFAFTDDIDAWLRGAIPDVAAPEAAVPEPTVPEPPVIDPSPVPVEAPPPLRAAPPVRWIAGAALVVLTFATAGLMTLGAGRRLDVWEVSVDKQGVHRTDGGSGRRTVFSFDSYPGAIGLPRTHRESVVDLDGDGALDIIAGISVEERLRDRTVHSGRLLSLTPDGVIRWEHRIDDVIRFGGESFDGPWTMTDWRPSPDDAARPPRIAFVAHHYTWWPSVVGMLDAKGNRTGTFVNAGWVEGVRWLSPDRVLIAGFNNPRDGGMVAILDAASPAGRSPEPPGRFQCESCTPAGPLAYFVFPRSELNLLTASRFNRAQAEVSSTAVTVITQELGEEVPGATAIYEFDLQMTLRRAVFSDQYWDSHRRLELEGKIRHARDACPFANGPGPVQAWSAAGWKAVFSPGAANSRPAIPSNGLR